MSSEWRLLTLKEAGVSLIDCDHKTPPASEEGYPYIAIPQLKNGHISLEGVRRISHVDYLEWTKKLKPQANDVIVVRRCNSGDSAHVPAGLDCAIGQNLVVLRASGERVRPDFLRWLLKGPEWWAQVSKFINVGAVFDSLRCRDIPNFELMIPPLVEQAEIARVLGAIDNRITLLRETNATLEAIAQALFKSWFVDFDPVRAKAEGRQPEGMGAATAALFPDSFEESELGLVPKGWAVRSIYDIARVIYGAPFASKRFNSDPIGIPLVRIRDLKDESPGIYTDEVHPKGYMIQPGDIVVGMDGEFRAYLWGGKPACSPMQMRARLAWMTSAKVGFSRRLPRPR
ncbi:restriction endonuclease subunit S [Stutzerimonas chloritidismutans]